MNKKNTKKLYTKYPKLFAQKDLPITQTAMTWGFQMGDGWFWLIDHMCSQLQWDIDRNKYPQVEFNTMKEKFGTARFYYGYAEGVEEEDKHKYGVQEGIIRLAEFMSGGICEECGSTKDVKTQGRCWVVTRCKECMKKLTTKSKSENTKNP